MGWRPSSLPNGRVRSTKAGSIERCSQEGLIATKKSRGGFYVSPAGEFERLVADRAEAQAEEIADVVLIEPPRPFGSLARKQIDRALDIAGREVDQRFRYDGRVVQTRRAGDVTVPVHIFDQPGDIGAGQIAFQRPGRVGVSDHGGEVRDIAEHDTFEVHGLREINRLAVDRHAYSAEQF